jgi:uncharacterized membrane protein YphA (DoxX/SURF4 family)
MTIFQSLLQTDSGVVGLILRITLAVVMFPHGVQKVLGWFGGQGFNGTMKHFTDSGIPSVFALLAIAAKFLGPLGLAVGFLTRIAAFGIACMMIVAIDTVHAHRSIWHRKRFPFRFLHWPFTDVVCRSNRHATDFHCRLAELQFGSNRSTRAAITDSVPTVDSTSIPGSRRRTGFSPKGA